EKERDALRIRGVEDAADLVRRLPEAVHVVVVHEAHALLLRAPAQLAQEPPQPVELLARRRAVRGPPRDDLERASARRLHDPCVADVRTAVVLFLPRKRVHGAAREAEAREPLVLEPLAELGRPRSPAGEDARAELDAAESQRRDVLDRPVVFP